MCLVSVLDFEVMKKDILSDFDLVFLILTPFTASPPQSVFLPPAHLQMLRIYMFLTLTQITFSVRQGHTIQSFCSGKFTKLIWSISKDFF